jgi:sialate O-acetylesterase
MSILCLAFVGTFVHAGAFTDDLSFSSVFGDNMVLQRDAVTGGDKRQAAVYGGGASSAVTVTMTPTGATDPVFTSTATAAVDANGSWKLLLPPTAASKPGESFTVTATSSHSTVELKEVVFGDVWFCSGMSLCQPPPACHCCSFMHEC